MVLLYVVSAALVGWLFPEIEADPRPTPKAANIRIASKSAPTQLMPSGKRWAGGGGLMPEFVIQARE